ncbi:MAG TPA: DUF4245 domain-containing protein [Streptosporangiaceae bacterium]|nr:DUF4245 domain-containing protein [Streptosporangiaceae bacterium]
MLNAPVLNGPVLNGPVLSALLRGTACLLGAALIVVAIPAPHAAEPAPISYAGDLARLARLAPYPAVAPERLPASWQPVSSGLAVGGGNGPGTVTWQLGFMTPDGALAALAETNASPAAFVRRMTNDGMTLPPTQLDGQAWSRSSAPDRGQRSMYLTSAAGVTVVVTGSATWAQLRQLAAALRPVTR